jgi:cell division protein FtsA
VARRTGTIAALDIGTSKVTCFIARADGQGNLRVTGIGNQRSRGVRCGNLVDMDAAETAILQAVHAAEQMAGEQIREIAVNISCGYPSSNSYALELDLHGREITDRDVKRILSQITLPGETAERDLIHTLPTGYTLDGHRGIKDPRGMFGDRLGMEVHLVSAASSAVRNLTNCVARCHLDIAERVVSPYAAGLACLVPDEIDLGVTLIDMGGGTTSIAVFYEGDLVYTDSIPVGGDHVTSDIARGLSTPIAEAERLKLHYGRVGTKPGDEREIISVPLIGETGEGAVNQVARSILIGIVQPRIEETFELVRARLAASGVDKIAGRRAVFVGGASQLPGVDEFGALILDKQVRRGRPNRLEGLAEATAGPAFAVCAGLLAFETRRARTTSELGVPDLEDASHRPLGRLGSWFRENF